MTTLVAAWQSTKVVRTREKISFFLGVMAVALSALMFGLTPSYAPFLYSLSHTDSLPSLPPDGYTSLTRLVPSSSSPCVPTHTKRNCGTTSSSTFATMRTSSVSFTSGSSLPVPPCSSQRTVSHTARSPARLSRGAIALCFMIRIR